TPNATTYNVYRATTPMVYYVAPGGSDSAAGTVGGPCGTLQHAADMVHAGDTVFVQPGSYAGFSLTTSGTAAAPITFQSIGAVISSPVAATGDGIDLVGASYVTIQDFELGSMPAAGICIMNAAGDVVRGNYIRRSGTSAIYLHGTTQVAGSGIVSGALIEGNILYSNVGTTGGTITGDGVQNSVIRNNDIYGNYNPFGILLYRADASGPSTGDVVANNTVTRANANTWLLGLQNGSTGAAIFHNALTDSGARGSLWVSTDSRAGLASDDNALLAKAATAD